MASVGPEYACCRAHLDVPANAVENADGDILVCAVDDGLECCERVTLAGVEVIHDKSLKHKYEFVKFAAGISQAMASQQECFLTKLLL